MSYSSVPLVVEEEEDLVKQTPLNFEIEVLELRAENAKLKNQITRLRENCFIGLLVLLGIIIILDIAVRANVLDAETFSRFTPSTPSFTPTNSPTRSISISPSISVSPSSSLTKGLAPVTPSKTPAPSEKEIPIIFNGKLWWDGSYKTFPEPITEDFTGPPAPEAKGRYSYVTMVSGKGKDTDEYCCLGLTLMTSLQQTNPDPSIDRTIILLIQDYDDRFPLDETSEKFRNIKPKDVIGEMFYNAFIAAGVNNWIVWRELDLKSKNLAGSWKQAFSKLRVWSLVQYEKVLFLDSDTMILKNIDHLFKEKEYTAAPSWDGGNPNSPLRPSGGFWLIQPSLNTWGLIQTYLKGRDPCGNHWRQGDMTITRVLFLNVSSMRFGDETTWQQYDGDFHRWGRCALMNLYPQRVDADKNGVINPGSRWNMLNESYDILVPICGEPAFVQSHKDRYNLLRRGKEIFDRPDAMSVHFTCGRFKPTCERNIKQLETLAPCARDMFEQWYSKLQVHYKKNSTV